MDYQECRKEFIGIISAFQDLNKFLHLIY